MHLHATTRHLPKTMRRLFLVGSLTFMGTVGLDMVRFGHAPTAIAQSICFGGGTMFAYSTVRNAAGDLGGFVGDCGWDFSDGYTQRYASWVPIATFYGNNAEAETTIYGSQGQKETDTCNANNLCESPIIEGLRMLGAGYVQVTTQSQGTFTGRAPTSGYAGPARRTEPVTGCSCPGVLTAP